MTDPSVLPPTERADAASRDLDLLAPDDLAAVLIEAHRRAVDAAARAAPAVGLAVREIAARLRSGGTLHYVGAGTSGRLGALDAAECPPTFGVPATLVQAHLAGGNAALLRAVEGAEDDASAGARLAHDRLRPNDAVLGLSASGGAPFVLAAIGAARAAGTWTGVVVCDPAAPLIAVAERAIVLETGPEPLAGSTRLVAGTAQKIVLGTVSTAVMTQLGCVYDNLMVDVVATNAKLRARAARLVRLLAPADEVQAADLLARAGGRVKIAALLGRGAATPAAAEATLRGVGGSLRAAFATLG